MAKVKAIYVGVFLSPAEKEKLLALIPPTHNVPYADHLTIAFKPSLDLLKALPIGEMVTFTVIGYADSEGAQAVRISCSIPTENNNPHITISCDSEVPPKKSNEILHLAQPCEGFLFEGRVGIFTGKSVQYSLEGL